MAKMSGIKNLINSVSNTLHEASAETSFLWDAFESGPEFYNRLRKTKVEATKGLKSIRQLRKILTDLKRLKKNLTFIEKDFRDIQCKCEKITA